CSRRFAAESHVRCYLNDGRSLSMIPDASVDFVFSFDSFIHVRREIVEAYLSELGRTLKIGGKGFIHHSNLGAYADSLSERIPQVDNVDRAPQLSWRSSRPEIHSSASRFRRQPHRGSGFYCGEEPIHSSSRDG